MFAFLLPFHRQRYQHKLKHSGHHSTLSDEREAILNQAGFIYDSHRAAWQEQFQLLEQFSMTFGHCNVPTRYKGSAALNVWCKVRRKDVVVDDDSAMGQHSD